MDDSHYLSAQRNLRRRLLDDGSVRWRPAQDLAARLLLYLDDPRRCWQEAADWLRDALDADRVDGGPGGYLLTAEAPCVYEPLVESRRPSLGLPSVLGHRFDPDDPGIRVVWQSMGPTPFEDVAQTRLMTPGLRDALGVAGTAAKLALPLLESTRPFGLLCADWVRPRPHWNAEVCNQMAEMASAMLAPILSTSARLAACGEASGEEVAALHSQLTPAERKVAQLVAQGLSYKEVARRLDRSFSTIDHQLRSIREKLGASSTSRLVRLLNERTGTPPLN